MDEPIASIRLEGGWGTALVAGRRGDPLRMQAPRDRPTSAVLGTAVLGRPCRLPMRRRSLRRVLRSDPTGIDRSVFGWPMTEIRRFEPPIEAKGAQGFWWWSTSEVDVAIAETRAAA